MMRQHPVILWQCTVMMFTVVVTACAHVPPAVGPLLPPDLAWQARKSEMEKFPSWRLTGRISVKSPQDAWNASIDWWQQDNTFDIHFMSHLGQVVAQLRGRPGQAVLRTSDEEVTATDVNGLLSKHFGWVIPVQGLRYWVLGLPEPQPVDNKELDGQGRLVWLEQSGWHIDFVRYRKAGKIEIPGKMVLEYPDLRVRLIIDRWEPHSDIATDRHGTRRSLMIENAYSND